MKSLGKFHLDNIVFVFGVAFVYLLTLSTNTYLPITTLSTPYSNIYLHSTAGHRPPKVKRYGPWLPRHPSAYRRRSSHLLLKCFAYFLAMSKPLL